MAVDVKGLFERDGELEIAAAALEAAAGGTGAVLAVECDPGLGKTALLDAIVVDAQARGFLALRGRGVELETILAYGVVRQLLARTIDGGALADAPAAARQVLADVPPPGDETDDPFAALYGLYAVCGALAEQAPVLLVVDDAQWADAASLRFAAFLRERLDGLPALIALGLRPPAHGDRDGLAAQLASDSRTIRLEPEPLSADAAAMLLRERLPAASDALSRACHEASGGNPFYLRSLAHELATTAGEPVASDVASLAPQAVQRAVLARLGRLGPDAVAVAHAVAVLGSDAEARLVATFTELPLDRVTMIADALTQAGVLADARPLAFVHAIVRSTVVADLPTGMQALARRRAAQILMDDGAAPQRVALQLLATEPGGEAWVVDALERGAAATRGPGARETAVELLRRALAEPPPTARRPALLAALGIAERHVMAPEAAARLESALAVTDDEDARLTLTVELAAAREQQGRVGDAIALLEQALGRQDTAGGEAAAALLEAQIVAGRLVAMLPAPRADRARARERFSKLDPATLEARLLAGTLALDEAARGGTAAAAGALVGSALGSPLEPAALETPLPMVALVAAVAAGVPDLVLRAVDVNAAARETGSRWTAAALATWRGLAAHHCGDLADAEADATGALEGFADLPVGLVAAAGVLADVLLDRRDPAAAAEVIARAQPSIPQAPVTQALFLRQAAARVALAQNRPAAALAAASEVGALLEGAAMTSWALFPWRLVISQAQLAAGEVGPARETALAQLEAARAFGEPALVSQSLVALGLATGDDAGLSALRDAVDAAEGCGRPLVEAHALGALGGALRRGLQTSDARVPLLAALERADACGAGAVSARLREELAAAGVRARRPRDEARWELTPSELRVARLAANGMTNREIAQTLFVTTKTVETHLRSAFRKLDLSSRRELGNALSERPETSPA
jgi:DNA-binding CsgD family transcriptional regulator/tetratricopeptide (TPR) repeat protein